MWRTARRRGQPRSFTDVRYLILVLWLGGLFTLGWMLVAQEMGRP